MSFISYITGFIELFYPRLCIVCEKSLVENEKYLCSRCLYYFPYSYGTNSVTEQKIRKLCQFESLHSLFRYSKESSYKNLIHAIKYRHQKDLAVFLGRMLGIHIQDYEDIELIVPLPLHPAREKARGFNQATMIANGISKALGIPVIEDCVKRLRNNPSQTGLSPEQRTKNTQNLFEVINREPLIGKHLLVVDDVITTGATLSSLLKELYTIEGVKASIACLARTTSLS